MTDLAVRAPSGPAAWLFPELRAACADEPVLLSRVCAAAQRLRADASIRVVCTPGPLGHAVAAALRPFAREPWLQVPHVASEAPPTSLEGLVGTAARSRPGTTLEVHRRNEAVHGDPAPLTRERAAARVARSSESAWILPISSGAEGIAMLAEARAVVAAAPELFAAAGLVPLFATTGRLARLSPSWWGLVPGGAEERDLAVSYEALLHILWPERVLTWRGYESLALSGCDLYSLALQDAIGVAATPGPRPRARIVGICGIDGSGKSSQARALVEALVAQGRKAVVRKIYRHGLFHETVTDLTRHTADGRALDLWRTERLAKAFDSVKCWVAGLADDLATQDVVVFDRYVHTHWAAGTGRCHWDPFTRELLSVYPEPDLLFLMDVPVETSLARIGERAARTVDENPYMLGRYREMLLRLARGGAMTVLDGTAPHETNAARIHAAVAALLSGRSVP